MKHSYTLQEGKNFDKHYNNMWNSMLNSFEIDIKIFISKVTSHLKNLKNLYLFEVLYWKKLNLNNIFAIP